MHILSMAAEWQLRSLGITIAFASKSKVLYNKWINLIAKPYSTLPHAHLKPQ